MLLLQNTREKQKQTEVKNKQNEDDYLVYGQIRESSFLYPFFSIFEFSSILIVRE